VSARELSRRDLHRHDGVTVEVIDEAIDEVTVGEMRFCDVRLPGLDELDERSD
jgi:hypothetical protein